VRDTAAGRQTTDDHTGDHRRCHRDILAAALAAQTGLALRHVEVGRGRDGPKSDEQVPT
jgi:hypothetical protein